MLTIYRVEDEGGLGPYVNLHSTDAWTETSHVNLDRTPGPGEDTIVGGSSCLALHINGADRFGFANLEQLCSWFVEQERRNLDRLGFKISVYEVPCRDAICTSKQVAFRRGDRQPIAKISLLDAGLHAKAA
jgi:hypothetical protein